MRSLVSIAVVAALGAAARADVSDRFTPLPRRSIAVSMLMGASSFSRISEGGGGIAVELAIARRRIQYFGEGSTSVVGLSVKDVNGGTALGTRLVGGIRWVPRSFTADEVSLDLLFEAFAGVEHLRWSGEPITRPQLGGGLGWQVRMARLTIRLSTRVFVAPTSDAAAMAVCRGTCPTDASPTTSFGFLGLFGVAW
ncbi:hypothetical protein BH11MYX3_BH11MYX3_47680 [soil metagenome]